MSMKRRVIGIAFTLAIASIALFAGVSIAQAADVTVGAPGSGAAHTTIAAAVAAANDGDTILIVDSGSYAMPTPIIRPLEFAADAGQTPVITNAFTINNPTAAVTSGADNITFRGLTFSGIVTFASGTGTFHYGNVIFDNNIFSPATSTTASRLVVSAVTTANITVSNSTFPSTNVTWATTSFANARVGDISITGNTVNGIMTVSPIDATSITVSNNPVMQALTSSPVGIVSGAITISENTVSGTITSSPAATASVGSIAITDNANTGAITSNPAGTIAGGITISGNGSGVSPSLMITCSPTAVSNVGGAITISGNTISAATGITMAPATGSTIMGNVTLSNNTITATTTGIAMSNNLRAANLTISGNTIQNPAGTIPPVGTAINLANSTASTGALTIDNNALSMNTGVNFAASTATAPAYDYGFATINVTNNALVLNGTGSGVTFAANNATNPNVYQTQDVYVTGNTFTYGPEVAVNVIALNVSRRVSGDYIVMNNTFVGSSATYSGTTGVVTIGSSALFDPNYANITFEKNAFEGSTAGTVSLRLLATVAGIFDASKNYWGSAMPALQTRLLPYANITSYPWYIDAAMTTLYSINSDTVYVGTQPGDFPTLAMAVVTVQNRPNSELTVIFREGTHIADSVVTILPGKEISIYSEDASNPSIYVRGAATGNLIVVSAGGKLILSDVIIDGNNNGSTVNHASLISVLGAFDMHEGTVLRNNRANNGAAVSVQTNALMNMTGGLIIENSAASSASGIHVNGSATESGVLNMTGGVIRENVAGVNAAGVQVAGGIMNFSGGLVTENTAGARAGGLDTSTGNGGVINMTGGVVSHNKADFGGGIGVSGLGGTLYMSGGEVVHNETTLAGGGIYTSNLGIVHLSGGKINHNSTTTWGGGIYLWRELYMTGGEISYNESGQDGGGLFIIGSPAAPQSVAYISGGSIVGNKTDQLGEAIYVTPDSHASPDMGLWLSGDPVIEGTIFLPEDVRLAVSGELTRDTTYTIQVADPHLGRVVGIPISIPDAAAYAKWFVSADINPSINDYYGVVRGEGNDDMNLVLGENPVIESSADPGGAISPSGTTVVNYGNDQIYTITPNPGHHIVDVLVDGQSVGAVSSYTFENVIENHTISVTFAINVYKITATAGKGGSIAPKGVTEVAHGGSQAYTITTAKGYRIAAVLVDGKSVGVMATYTFENVGADHTIHVVFEKVTSPPGPTPGPTNPTNPDGGRPKSPATADGSQIMTSLGLLVVSIGIVGLSVRKFKLN